MTGLTSNRRQIIQILSLIWAYFVYHDRPVRINEKSNFGMTKTTEIVGKIQRSF